ncbi:unnamed protein product [Sphagnum jensenii]
MELYSHQISPKGRSRGGGGGGGGLSIEPMLMLWRERRLKPPDQVMACPRCQSLNTKFCYYNNYSLTQPRHFCKNCRRYWTAGGTLRNVPVGGGCRKNKRAKHRNSADGQSSSGTAGNTENSLQQLCVKASDQASPPPPPPSTSPPLQLAGADHLYITDLAASHMSTSTQNAVSRYSCKAHRKRKRSSIANTTATETNYHTDSSSVYTRSSSYDHSCWNRIVTNPLQLEKRRLAGYNVYHSRSSMSRTSSTAAAATRAARKHRMAYQRQQLIGRSCAAGKQPAAAAINSSSSSDYAMQQQPTASAATGLAAPGPSTGTLVLLLHKLLQPSDVTSLGRIVLPKKEAESCLPYLAVKEGMSLAMEDFDTGKTWKVRYRYWPNNRSRMYLIENTGVFVRSHQLEEGDLLILYRNVERNKIVIQGKKKTQSDGSCIGAAVKDEKLSAAAAAADAIATQDSGGLVMPRLDAKLQRMAVKWEQEITKDQASSQLQLHCPVSAVLETASHKAGDGTQFEDSSDLGDLMQGIFQDKKHGSSCGLAPGGQNFQQLLSFPSLKDSDLLMADVSHLPSWDVNSTAATAAVISKVEPDEMNSRVVPSNIASLESEASNQPRKGAKVAGAGT